MVLVATRGDRNLLQVLADLECLRLNAAVNDRAVWERRTDGSAQIDEFLSHHRRFVSFDAAEDEDDGGGSKPPPKRLAPPKANTPFLRECEWPGREVRAVQRMRGASTQGGMVQTCLWFCERFQKSAG